MRTLHRTTHQDATERRTDALHMLVIKGIPPVHEVHNSSELDIANEVPQYLTQPYCSR